MKKKQGLRVKGHALEHGRAGGHARGYCKCGWESDRCTFTRDLVEHEYRVHLRQVLRELQKAGGAA